MNSIFGFQVICGLRLKFLDSKKRWHAAKEVSGRQGRLSDSILSRSTIRIMFCRRWIRLKKIDLASKILRDMVKVPTLKILQSSLKKDKSRITRLAGFARCTVRRSKISNFQFEKTPNWRCGDRQIAKLAPWCSPKCYIDTLVTEHWYWHCVKQGTQCFHGKNLKKFYSLPAIKK